MPNYKFKSITSSLKLSKGFTLIELLVVISIIGILASFITFSFTESQAKSRDSKRKADLDAIKKAVELAKQDTAGAYSYPYCTTAGAATCFLTSNTSITTGGTNYVAPTYIKNIPLDPKTKATYTGYIYSTFSTDTTTPTTCSSSTLPCTFYRIEACLENTKDPQKSPTTPTDLTNATCNTETRASYRVTNMQQ